MRQIAKNFKGHMVQVVMAPLVKLVEAVLELFVPLVMADIIDVGVANRDTAYILRGGLILLALAAGGILSATTCQYFSAVAAGRFGRSLRAQLFGHVMGLSGGEVAQFGAGGLVTRLTNDAGQIQTGVNMFLRLGTRVPFLIVGGLVMALRVNARMGLVFLAAMPLIGVVLFVVMRLTLPSYGRIQARQDDLARISGENLAGVRVIRAFARQKDEAAEFAGAAGDLTAIMVRVGRVSAILNPLTGFVASAAMIAIVWLGGRLAFDGRATPGQVVALVGYMGTILLAMILAANLIVLFTRAAASAKRVAALLQTRPSVTDGPGAEGVQGAAAIRFEDVTFTYHEGAEPALERVCFEAARGETIGVIGGTGSGKSTLASVMLRSFDVQGGRVLVDGRDVRDYTLHQLLGRFGLVPQTALLFGGSVRHNLQMAAPGADDEALWQALRAAQAADFVERMDGGLDAVISEGGKNLSGGQRQRLTIARSLVRKPEILVLDDAFSALDYATDARLRAALRAESEREGMTAVLISQRAASLRHADRILVLDEGELVGVGTHEALYRENVVYREICESQGVDGKGGVT